MGRGLYASGQWRPTQAQRIWPPAQAPEISMGMSLSARKEVAIRISAGPRSRLVSTSSRVSAKWVYNTSALDVAPGLPPLPMGED